MIECQLMATHRSLNKLEFRAHMSIHNMTDVFVEEERGSYWTRDRFGKNHGILEEDGKSRLWRPRTLMAMAMIAGSIFFVAPSAWATHSSTDMKVESDGFDEHVLDEKLNPPDENLTFYKKDDTSVALDDDAVPNMSTRF